MKHGKLGLLIVLLSLVLSYLPAQSFSPYVTDSLTQEILKLQLLEVNLKAAEQRANEAENLLEELQKSNEISQKNLEVITQNCEELSKDLKASEIKCVIWKSACITTSIAMVITTSILIYQSRKSK